MKRLISHVIILSAKLFMVYSFPVVWLTRPLTWNAQSFAISNMPNNPLTSTSKVFFRPWTDPTSTTTRRGRGSSRGRVRPGWLSPPLSMCICIHCARVTNCAAYYFVETKHHQPHMTENPSFTPRDGNPTIHANIRTASTTMNPEHVMDRVYREHQAEQELAVRKSQDETTALDNNNNNNDHTESQSSLYGKTVYDLSSTTTIEYDVVACEDFIEDKGCWVRNMPEEIRRANPHFVPT